MARVLVLYGTTDGHTAKVAKALAEAVRADGGTAEAVSAAQAGAAHRPEDYAGVLVAASVHAGGFQREVRDWARAHAAGLAARPNAFVAVCLGILQDDPRVRADLEKILQRFQAESGWTPRRVHWVAGALLYRQYNWIKRWMMRRIVAKAGGDTDTSRDYEYTDWKQVQAVARDFHRTLAAS